jgi:hypothetical protein
MYLIAPPYMYVRMQERRNREEDSQAYNFKSEMGYFY